MNTRAITSMFQLLIQVQSNSITSIGPRRRRLGARLVPSISSLMTVLSRLIRAELEASELSCPEERSMGSKAELPWFPCLLRGVLNRLDARRRRNSSSWLSSLSLSLSTSYAILDNEHSALVRSIHSRGQLRSGFHRIHWDPMEGTQSAEEILKCLA